MKRTYHNHNIEDYIDYHDIRYILHITKHMHANNDGLEMHSLD